MSNLAQDLADLLRDVRRPGDFFATGRCEIFAPRLEVDGVGPIALPLLPVQAAALVAVAEQAPYGRGSDTLVDTDVRRTWQIAADRVQLGGRHWGQHLADIVARCAAGLGISEPVSAEFYKLLVYDAGSFFLSHRDTEKAPGMFATLVVVLPSLYSGGELCIRHGEREVCLDLSSPEPAEIAYAAFYADCRHEVRPITAGCRLVLVYNLIRHGPGHPPGPPAYDAEIERVGGFLGRWAAERSAAEPTAVEPTAAGPSSPAKLIHPLEHAYTPAEIGFRSLKGVDAAVASVLASAAARADCELHLAFLAISESGSAEYCGQWSRGRRHSQPDDDDFEVLDICERSSTLSGWQAPDGSRPGLGNIPFVDAELCPPGALDDEEPDEQHFFEATGNAGASFERSYRRTALVLWPQAGKLQVIASAGQRVSLAYLAALVERWVEQGKAQGSPLRREGQRLARLIIARREDWPTTGWLSPTPAARAAPMLTALRRFEDSGSIEAVLADVSAAGCYDAGDNEAVAEAAALLPAERAADLAQRIIARNAPLQIGACAGLLQRMAARFLVRSATGVSTELLEPAARALVAALPGDPAAAMPTAGARLPLPVTPDLVVDLLTALCHLGVHSLGEQAVEHLLNWPESFSVDAILVPAACLLTENGWPANDWPPTRRLRAHCLDHLARRINQPLAPPVDFARPSSVGCSCAHCRELSGFLADPVRSVWVFRAAQKWRSHVEHSIRRDQCDVSHETDRRGNTHALVCTKNLASFERRVAQRQKDLADRARLRQPSGQ
ncbi:2OG-Fe(II) oxygenase [Accumulibacter sp.]|uniref:2OG-Fe(II) oxygenase n=1 Tax=Accumulibacter sp. TaxID=2053492 RepID=UPI0025D4D727|nr:2OG-Fe(II) oxygenase [Accumulibacter sp.]MCM8611763.1 2OG-Fe(II) oxygenase [Accumulibacter sp.]MCM8635646.1 2OG-Fe(II) oxygenase [Accumulibacter sp.]MCM8639233.1 2OG-Fe(II) oxygenase [Accumulibacter sp.]